MCLPIEKSNQDSLTFRKLELAVIHDSLHFNQFSKIVSGKYIISNENDDFWIV
jgi:hypothetical protein